MSLVHSKALFVVQTYSRLVENIEQALVRKAWESQNFLGTFNFLITFSALAEFQVIASR